MWLKCRPIEITSTKQVISFYGEKNCVGPPKKCTLCRDRLSAEVRGRHSFLQHQSIPNLDRWGFKQLFLHATANYFHERMRLRILEIHRNALITIMTAVRGLTHWWQSNNQTQLKNSSTRPIVYTVANKALQHGRHASPTDNRRSALSARQLHRTASAAFYRRLGYCSWHRYREHAALQQRHHNNTQTAAVTRLHQHFPARTPVEYYRHVSEFRTARIMTDQTRATAVAYSMRLKLCLR